MTSARALNVLLWHVHGSWTNSMVRGRHRYLLPTTAEADEWGRGRAGRDWPSQAMEISPDQLRNTDVDVVLLQRPEELELAHRWLGRLPGADVPSVFVEHNTPRAHAANSRHPMAEHCQIPLVHVTHFNELMWDSGRARTTVIPHGIEDPGLRYTGELARSAVLINEPMRRWRITGTDLLPELSGAAPIDLYGIGAEEIISRLDRVRGVADLRQRELHEEMAKRRVYLHTARWTSLGLSLVEAMHLGMPVVAVGSTEAYRAVPADAGVVSADVGELRAGIQRFMEDPGLAAAAGKAAREFAVTHYGLQAFLANWDELLTRVFATRPGRTAPKVSR